MNWNRLRTIVLFVILPLLMSCAECDDQVFTFEINFPVPKVFLIDQSGAFNETTTITASDIRGALDIPDDAKITQVTIESMELKVEVLEGNVASQVNASGSIQEAGGPVNFTFQDFPVPLPVGFIQRLAIDELIEQGINAIQNKVEGFILGLDDESFDVHFSGNSSPGGQRIHTSFTLTIRGKIEYEQCLATWSFITDGPECPASGIPE